MSNHSPQRTITGVCPNCGPSQLDVVLEGNSYFSGISTPNWWCVVWIAWCCECHAYLETCFDYGQEIQTLEWEAMDEEKVEFLFADS